MKLSVEELLKPRYEVIADYPGSPFEKGKVLEFDFNGKFFEHRWYEHDGQEWQPPRFFDEYPHLFKPLQWWERREASEMPEYVKDSKGEVWEVYKTCHNDPYILLEKNIQDPYLPYESHSLFELFPATQAEYSSYKQSIKS